MRLWWRSAGFLGLVSGASGAASAPEAAARGDPLWAALRHATGFTDEEMGQAAEELLALPAPAQRAVWQERIPCDGTKRCAGEVVARLLVALTEGRQLPLRGFEPFRGDPLFPAWKAADKQGFHSWVDGQVVRSPSEGLQALVPEGQPLAIGRLQAAQFFFGARQRILDIVGLDLEHGAGLLGRCLEWDSPFYAVKVFGRHCLRYDVLTYANAKAGLEEKLVDYEQGTRILSVDILSPPKWMPTDWGIVICLFVLEHVPDPHRALRSIAKVLLPGGFLLLGAPFIDGIHACPDDYLRYTPEGMKRAVLGAGLEVAWLYAPGAAPLAAGELLGLKSIYWREQELLEEGDTHPLNVFILARKPLRRRRPSNITST